MLDFDASRYPRGPRLRGLFVTGTDTEVGKTLVAGAIARSLRKAGRRVEVIKPVATGCRRDREGLISADAEFLAACADSRRTLAEIAPVRYASALAPNVAAEREGRPIDLDAIFAACARLAGDAVVVVEGIGGLLCPIRDDFWVVHFARWLALPVVIVARAGLGTINHTLLTLHAARAAGLRVGGVVVNRYPIEPEKPFPPVVPAEVNREPRRGPAGDADHAAWTNPRQIALRGRTRVLALVPDEPGNSVEKLTIGPDTQYVIDQVDWDAVMDG